MTQEKECPVCDKPIKRGSGMFFAQRLIHKICLPIAKLKYYELIKDKVVIT